MERIVLMCLLVLLAGCEKDHGSTGNYAAEGFSNDRNALAYAYGLDRGQGLVRRHRYLKEIGIDLDIELTRQGFLHALDDMDGSDPMSARLTIEQIKNLIYASDREVAAIEQNLARLESSVQQERGAAYLAKNAKLPGVIRLDSGLQYRVLAQGKGARVKENNSVLIHYLGRLVDGTEFDRSGTQPRTFEVTNVIAGWTEALQHMRAGDKWELTIPPDLGYGTSRYGKIPANAVLIFEIEIIEIKK